MEPLILGVVLVVGMLLVFSAGAPLVSRMAEAGLRQRRYVDTYDPGRRAALPAAAPARKPLDLGPDPLVWPSERRTAEAWVDELWWPSERWDDPYFGARARARTAASSASEPATPAPSAARPEAPKRRKKTRKDTKGRRNLPAELERPEVEIQSHVGKAWVPELPPLTGSAQQPRTVAASVADRLPPPDELVERIRAKGLARALREVAEATGLTLGEITEEVLRRRKG